MLKSIILLIFAILITKIADSKDLQTLYAVTDEGVSCSEIGMIKLDDSNECKFAIPFIQDVLPGLYYFGDTNLTVRPAGCYYTSGPAVYWNSHGHGGPCFNCRSICKGRCPESYPFSYNNGHHCCLTNKDYYGNNLKPTSPSCRNNKNIACPTLSCSSFNDLVSFNGYCRYGSGADEHFEADRVISVSLCQQACTITNGCTAFAFGNGWCHKYRGGPYTYGTGGSTYKCYAMPE